MRSARSIAFLAALISLPNLIVCGEHNALASTIQDEAGKQLDGIRQGQESSRDWLRERRGSRRARGISRRLSKSSSDLLPHRSDYVIQLSGYSTTRFTQAKGTLTLDLINDCSDWTLQEKLDVVLKDQAKKVYRSNLLYRATEKASTGRFVFAYSRDHLSDRQDFIGDAIPVNGAIVATFTEPKIADLLLPPDIVFPISHFRQVLAAARRQRGGFEAAVFDGANNLAYMAETRIFPPLRSNDSNPRVAGARAELERDKSDELPSGRTWPVTVKYYPLNDSYAAPILTREFMLHESGIIISFHFDYGDIQMDAQLKRLDIFEPFDCTAGTGRE